MLCCMLFVLKFYKFISGLIVGLKVLVLFMVMVSVVFSMVKKFVGKVC